MMRGSILQRIGELTQQFIAQPPWSFLPGNSAVRCLADESSTLLSALQQSFPTDQLRAARVLVNDPPNECGLSLVLAPDGSPFMILAREQDRHPFDIVSTQGSLVSTDPPAFHACCDSCTRAVSGEARRILAAFSDVDLAVLRLLALPCTPAAGLERMDGRRLRRLFGAAHDDGHDSIPRSQLAPICQEEYSLVLVNWHVAELQIEEPAKVRHVIEHLGKAADAFESYQMKTQRIGIWQPSRAELKSIRSAVEFADYSLTRKLMWRSMLRSTSTVSGYLESGNALQTANDYCAARRDVLKALSRGREVGPSELASRLEALSRSFGDKVVEAIVSDAMTASDPMERSLLLAASELMEHWHKSSDLVRLTQARAGGQCNSDEEMSHSDKLKDRLRIVDGLVKIHRELTREM